MDSSTQKYPTVKVLGDGWVAKVDEDYKQKFYYNRRTRRSTWTKPQIEVKPPGYSNNDIKSIESSQKAVNNWIKVFSNDYNRVYYYNKLTKTSVWDNPFDDSTEAEAHVLNSSKILLENEVDNSRNSFLDKRNLQLAEALTKVEQKKLQNEEHVDTSDKFTVKKNLKEYQEKNEDFDRSYLWKIKERKDDLEMDLKKEYDLLYNQLQKLIEKQKEEDRDVDELELYAEDLRKRTMKMYNKLSEAADEKPVQGNQSKIKFVEGETANQAEQKQPEDAKAEPENIDAEAEKLDPKEEMKRKHKMKVLERRKQEIEEKKHNSLALYMDEMEQVKEEKRAIEAEAEAKREAREKFEQIKMFKSGKGDFYKLLGTTSSATNGQIKKAYLKLMIQYHPDKNKRKKGEGEEELTEKETTERANLIKDAYQVLSDDWERFIYDEIGLEDYLLYQKILQAFKNYMMSGLKIKKHGRKGRRLLNYYSPKQRFIWLDFIHENINTGPIRILEITNEKERKAVKGMKLSEMTKLTKGMNTPVFKKTGKLRDSEKYFSIVSEERSLDLECESKQQRDFLVARINLLRVCKLKSKEAFQEHIKLYPIKKKKTTAAQKTSTPSAPRRKKIVKKKSSSDSSASKSSSGYDSASSDSE